MLMVDISCFWLERQLMALALFRAEFSAGSSIPARIAMMAITTRSSISVNPIECRWFESELRCFGFLIFHTSVFGYFSFISEASVTNSG